MPAYIHILTHTLYNFFTEDGIVQYNTSCYIPLAMVYTESYESVWLED